MGLLIVVVRNRLWMGIVVVIWVEYVIVLYVEVGMGAVDLVHTGSVKGTLECI